MKKFIKKLIVLVFKVILLPLVIGFRLKILGYMTLSCGLSLFPGLVGVLLRRAWYEMTLARCGKDLYVDFMAAIRTPKTAVGDNVYIGLFCWINWADIGDDVLLGGHITVLSGGKHHSFKQTDIPIRLQEGSVRQIKIGRDVWIGNKAVIINDIAEGSVVGAGSVVTKTFMPYSVIAGCPAKFIRSRN